MPTFGSLFAGIGGMDLGLERAGWQCRWQVEINPYCRRVLAKHWPDVSRHDDVKTFPPSEPSDWAVDLIAGGFPCQPVSQGAAMNGRKGVSDPRWLWPEYRRIVDRLRPRMVLCENVPGLASVEYEGQTLDDIVRSDLERLGYDTDPWEKIGACAVGSPQWRHRLFLVAHRDSPPLERRRILGDLARASRQAKVSPPEWEWHGGVARYRPTLARRLGRIAEGWLGEPGICRVADGVPSGVDRLTGLGNAVVPQVAEWIGRRLMECI